MTEYTPSQGYLLYRILRSRFGMTHDETVACMEACGVDTSEVPWSRRPRPYLTKDELEAILRMVKYGQLGNPDIDD